MVSCNGFVNELGNLLDHEADDEARQQISSHLNQCPACHALYESTYQTLRIVTASHSFEYPEPVAEPLVDKVMSRIRSNGKRIEGMNCPG